MENLIFVDTKGNPEYLEVCDETNEDESGEKDQSTAYTSGDQQIEVDGSNAFAINSFVIDTQGQHEGFNSEDSNVDVQESEDDDDTDGDDDDDEKEEEDDDDDDDDTGDDASEKEVSTAEKEPSTESNRLLPQVRSTTKTSVTRNSTRQKSKHEDDIDLNDVYVGLRSKSEICSKAKRLAKKFCNVDDIMKKSVLQPGFEQLKSVPPYEESKRRLKLTRKAERDKTKGEKWFSLPATEMTEEIKNDLEVLQMRSVLDPKHFYKKNDLKVLPKYFQVGRVIESPADFYHSRIPKKQRKRTLVDELLADAEFMRYKKKKYKEIIEEKNKLHYRAHRHAKRLKKKS